MRIAHGNWDAVNNYMDISLKVLVKDILEKKPSCRRNDKQLVWVVWTQLGFISDKGLTWASFLDKKCPSSEGITREKRRIQEAHPELRDASPVRQVKLEELEEEKAVSYGRYT